MEQWEAASSLLYLEYKASLAWYVETSNKIKDLSLVYSDSIATQLFEFYSLNTCIGA